MQRWFTGWELIKRWELQSFELLDLVKLGLQPFDGSTGKKIEPPGLAEKMRERTLLEQKISKLQAYSRAQRDMAEGARFVLEESRFVRTVSKVPKSSNPLAPENVAARRAKSADGEIFEKKIRLRQLGQEVSQLEDWRNYSIEAAGQSGPMLITQLCLAVYKAEDVAEFDAELLPVRGEAEESVPPNQAKEKTDTERRNEKIAKAAKKAADRMKKDNPKFTREDIAFSPEVQAVPGAPSLGAESLYRLIPPGLVEKGRKS